MNLPRWKATVYAVLLFAVLFFGYQCAQAGSLEGGPTYLESFGDGYGVVYTERFGVYDLGLQLYGPQDLDGETVEENGGFLFQRVVTLPEGWPEILPHEMGLGGAVWIDTDDRLIACHLGFHLSVRWYLGEKFHVNWRHNSNAGTCRPNRGQDVLTFGWRF